MTQIYTTVEQARDAIWTRWHDKALREKVADDLQQDIPEVFLNEPRAVLFRNIASPDFEFLHFLQLAKQLGLKPVVLEYPQDKFSTRNADKLCLVKLAVFEKKNKHGESIVSYKKLIDIKANDNRRFADIETLNGKNLVDLHHELLAAIVAEPVHVYDMSAWIERNGKSASEYYKRFFMLFMCHGVLLENFVTNDAEADFQNRVVVPALQGAISRFSAAPMIAPLTADPNDMYWWSYPNEIREWLN